MAAYCTSTPQPLEQKLTSLRDPIPHLVTKPENVWTRLSIDSTVHGVIGPEIIKHHAMRESMARWRHLIGTARSFAANSPHAAQIQQLGKTLRASDLR